MTNPPKSNLLWVCSAKDALAIAERNSERKYPAREGDSSRLFPIALPQPRPSFEFSDGDTVFAIGSCFARNIENFLIDSDVNVLSRDFDFAFGDEAKNINQRDNRMNKYSIHSIINDLRWALERETYDPDACLIGLDAERTCDLQLGAPLLGVSLEQAKAMRQSYLDHLARVRDADVVLVTLGYVETWFDAEKQIYLNVMPPMPVLKRFPNRFEFRVLGFQDIMDGLQDLYNLLRKHRSKPTKVLMTVSPVPLLTTFRDVDVLVANTYSKSVQRAALETFAASVEGVDYFPSYETVVLSDPNKALCKEDFRHPSKLAITSIMTTLARTYMPSEDFSDQKMIRVKDDAQSRSFRRAAQAHLNANDTDAFLELMQTQREYTYGFPRLLLQEAALAVDLDAYRDHIEDLRLLVVDKPDKPLFLEALLTYLSRLGEMDDYNAYTAIFRERFPKRKGV